ncbi:Ribosome production factor 1 [Amphibalanus amphitrite]|uniref:Ribosome production factor 1 n=1 Tax=Amphibalanus amphitrite TaxID=1232801 RepID=A0A6A4WGM7_AMPAM|nr:Ribosome production factor 1 [Amphibalanus amphitrite]KAF0302975.1 Ribosome production factor 1 [Amphibalanus amphitrite]
MAPRSKPKPGEPSSSDAAAPLLPERCIDHKNKNIRKEKWRELRLQKNKEKREARKKRQKVREELGKDAPPVLQPHTIETLRIPDVTTVQPDDLETQQADRLDEFGGYFGREAAPRVLLTAGDFPSPKTRDFMKELALVIPNTEVRLRNFSSVKKTARVAAAKGYTDLIFINEDKSKKVMANGLLHVHLPDGPSALYRLSNVKLSAEMRRIKEFTHHRPEVVLNNFTTMLGHRVGRMLASLFHFDPEFKGRRVMTLHNQRDYIFFRHHRYEFKNEKKCALRELGPRFTLKLRSLQKGTFDSKTGEYEWIRKRHEMEDSRRKFHL